jgi:hypothetical protein
MKDYHKKHIQDAVGKNFGPNRWEKVKTGLLEKIKCKQKERKANNCGGSQRAIRKKWQMENSNTYIPTFAS